MNTNTIVVVGDRLDSGAIQPEQFFGGSVDPNRIIVGPLTQISYNSGKCLFFSVPDRIDLRVQSQDVMPQELWGAANNLLAKLEDIRSAISVTAIGMNCDVVLPAVGDLSGDFSNSFVQLDRLEDITGTSPLRVSTSSVYKVGDVQYTLRIEPEVASDGKNLFVAVNGNQNVERMENLTSKLDELGAFKDHVEKLHARLHRQFS